MTADRRDSPPDPTDARSTGLAQAEARVEAHSASLKKELGVRDLALTQILFIVGLTWIGVAGKLGPSHVVFWLLALVLFYLPSAAVVIYLNRLMPLEGGLYQWAKLGFNQTVGFMLAWNLWLYVIVFTSEIGVQCSTYLSYAIGPSAAWMTSSNWFVALSSAVILSLMVVTSTIGLSVGKWVHNTGGIFMITIFGAVVLLPVIGLLTGTLAEYHPFRTHLPELSLYNLNILGKMGFGALGGFEYMAILAGETRAPARSVTRSVFIAAPVIALMFVLGTSTVVAYVPNNTIDLIGPVAQVLRIGYGPFGIATPLVTVAILMTLAMRVGQASVAFTAVTRLPMVAGWDHMLPAWFSRLHATYKTPVNSINARGRKLVRDRVVEPHRRGAGGGVSARVQRERHLLRAHVCRDVRHPVVRAADGHAPATDVVAARVAVRPADDGSVHRALGVPDHPGRERVHLRPQDHDDGGGDEPGGNRDPALGGPSLGGGRWPGAPLVAVSSFARPFRSSQVRTDQAFTCPH